MFTHVRETQVNRKYARAKWTGDDNRVAFACFTDDHTGETSEIKISTSTRKRKMFLFLVVALVLISCMFPALVLVLILFHKCEPGLRGY